MKFSDGIKMALKDLRRRLGRTFLTTLGIIIGTFLIVAMLSLGLGFRDFLVNDFKNTVGSKLVRVVNMDSKAADSLNEADENGDLEKLMEIQEESTKKIDDEVIKKIKEMDNVESVIAKLDGNVDSIKLGDTEKSGYIPISGYSTEGDLFSESTVQLKRDANSDDNINYIKYGNLIKSNGEAIIEETYLKDIFNIENAESVIGKEITLTVSKAKDVNIKPVSKTFKIVGVLDKEFNEYGVFLSSADASDLLSASNLVKNMLGEQGYSMIDVNAKTADDVDKVSEEISELGYYNQTSKSAIEEVNEQLNKINLILGLLGIIVLVVAAIDIVNTMTMSVFERTKSIGVMKSQGATSGDIQLIFITESGIIGLIGGGIGSLLGTGIAKLGEIIINQMMSGEAGSLEVSLSTPPLLIVVTIVGAIAIAVLSGLYPSIRASKMSPVEALK